MIKIYTDGGCWPNPGEGACAFVAVNSFGKVIFRKSAYRPKTTNNRMELGAAIMAIDWLKKEYGDELKSVNVTVISDSQYLVKGMNDWSPGWIAKDFRGVKNPDLWRWLLEHSKGTLIKWQWVKGHSGVKYNEMADKICFITGQLKRPVDYSKSYYICEQCLSCEAIEPQDVSMELDSRLITTGTGVCKRCGMPGWVIWYNGEVLTI